MIADLFGDEQLFRWKAHLLCWGYDRDEADDIIERQRGPASALAKAFNISMAEAVDRVAKAEEK